MNKDTDVFADNTVAENEKHDERGGRKDKSAPGEKVFKERNKSHRHGYTNLPGAGPNPAK